MNSSLDPATPDANREPALQCAVAFLDVIPVVMGLLRCELHRHSANALTLAQFRVVVFLDRCTNASLSRIADFLGLGLPTTSKVIDGLVNSRFVERRVDPADRRRVLLELSPAGKREAETTRRTAQNALAKMLAPLSEAERTGLQEAMQSLRPLFLNRPVEPCG